MSEHQTVDPYEILNKLTSESEKQLNELFRSFTNNCDFFQDTNTTSDSTTLFHERNKKYQQMFETQLNLPSKIDLNNIAKLSIRTSEKVDFLEEEIWKLKELVNSSNKEIEGVLEVSRNIIELTKKIKTDFFNTKVVKAEINDLRSEFQEIKKELADFKLIKEEISNLLGSMHLPNY
ncbi:polyhydroxyalkanoate biosynthesis repressor PhaR [Gottfriedia acidiceleris]|uniref:polyhydroxyalkanoate biosynthesis repressor PhaR n=1 Tax=Gottfriedia acidiceleris TaxID=371036 RepID=UPI003D21C9B9